MLRTYGRYVDRGMIPNRFPNDGAPPESNTVDATLWYVAQLPGARLATIRSGEPATRGPANPGT